MELFIHSLRLLKVSIIKSLVYILSKYFEMQSK